MSDIFVSMSKLEQSCVNIYHRRLIISPTKMSSHLLNQLKQELQQSLFQKLASFQQHISREINITKQFMQHQGIVNQNHQQNHQKMETDLGILKLLCIQQTQKIQKLKSEVHTLRKQGGINIKEDKYKEQDDFIIEALEEKTELSSPRKKSNIVRQNSIKTQNERPLNDNNKNQAFRQSFPVSFFSANLFNPKKPQKEKEEHLPPVDSVSNSNTSTFPHIKELLASGQINDNLRDTLINTGQQLRNANKFKQSLNYYFQANQVCIKLKEEQATIQAQILFWIASDFSGMGNYTQAIRYYNQELSIRESIKQTVSQNVAATLNNIGHNYFRKKEYKKAIRCFEDAIQMQIKVKGNSNATVGLYIKNLAQVYFSLDNYRFTEKYCEQTLQILDHIGDHNSEIGAWCHYFMAVIWFKNKKYVDCLKKIIDSLQTQILPEKKEQIKDMLKVVKRSCGNKSEVLHLVGVASNLVQERNGEREILEENYQQF